MEFFKTRARKERYREELLYLRAEKQQTTVSYEKTALDWDRREGESTQLKSCAIIAQGAAAYAAERASSERALGARCRDLWGVVSTSWGGDTGAIRAPVVSRDDGAEEEREDEDLHFSITADAESDVDNAQSDDSDDELM